MSEQDIIAKLDELIAVQRSMLDIGWTDAKGVGAIIGCKPRYVLERLSKRSDFPIPTRRGHPRWKRSEVYAWKLAHREEFAHDETFELDTSTSLYRHFDEQGKLLYVGISLSAVYRLKQHGSRSRWVSKICKVAIERFPTRDEAKEAEIRAIQSERPIYNRVHRQ